MVLRACNVPAIGPRPGRRIVLSPPRFTMATMAIDPTTADAINEMRKIVQTEIAAAQNPDAGYLSVSRLGTYTGCGEKYRLKYIEHAPSEPQGAFVGGLAVHRTIQWCESEGIPERFHHAGGYGESHLNQLVTDRFHHEFAEEIERVGGADKPRWGGRKTKDFPDGENAMWWARTGPMMLRRYLTLRLDDIDNGFQPIDGGVEMNVAASLPNGTMVRGIIDAALVADPDGVPHIRDYKTGSWQSDPMQLATYSWLIGETRGIHPQHGAYVYLRTGADRGLPKIVSFDLDRFGALVPEFFARLEQGLTAGVFPINAGPFCKSCSVRAACAYGRLIGEIDG